ncbi:hypothetical protein FOPE_05258 [Fonsecaea pedrosoi]|nr:hypothetical protein FOPE_05258 [Fonsecaea pedrosoi]
MATIHHAMNPPQTPPSSSNPNKDLSDENPQCLGNLDDKAPKGCVRDANTVNTQAGKEESSVSLKRTEEVTEDATSFGEVVQH